MPEEVIRASTEVDTALNQYGRGEVDINELEAKREKLHKELRAWEDSKEDRKGW